MATFDTMAWLHSVLGHFTQHPSLLGTVSNFEADEAHLRVGGVDLVPGDKLRAFAGWLASMRNVSSVTFTAVPGGATLYTHLHASGQLTDGHMASVWVSLQADDVKPLVGHVEFAAGNSFPVEVLLAVTGTSVVSETLDQEPDDDAVMRTDRQIDAVAENWSPGGVAALSAALLDAGPGDDEPPNPAHTAELEQAIGHPIPDVVSTGGAE